MRHVAIALLLAASVAAQDLPCSATPLSSDGNYLGDTSTLSSSGVSRSCAGGNSNVNDAWYSFTSLGNGTFTATTCATGTGYDTSLTLYSGPDCTTLTEVACNDDDFTCGISIRSSTLSVPTTAGTSYWLRVAGFSTNAGAYELVVSSSSVFPLPNPLLGVNGQGFLAPSCTDINVAVGPQTISLDILSDLPNAGLVIGAAGSCSSPGVYAGTNNTVDLDYGTLVWVVDGTGQNLMGTSSIWNQLAVTDASGSFNISATTTMAAGQSFAFQAGVLDPSQLFGIDITQALSLSASAAPTKR